MLLLGVGHDNNTSLHLAEHRAALPVEKPRLRQGSPMLVDGERRWVEYTELADDTSLFEPLGKDFAAITELERVGPVGSGTARLMRQRALVDFGAMWLSRRFS
ncbi:hypothetical protein GCM10027610_131180 [Dactylosporangium cerinum]